MYANCGKTVRFYRKLLCVAPFYHMGRNAPLAAPLGIADKPGGIP